MDLTPQLPSTTLRIKFCWLREEKEIAITDHLSKCNIPILNVGQKIASAIDPATPGADLSLQVTKYLSDLLKGYATEISGYDAQVVAIYNIGMIKEPKLNLNFENILIDVCRSICVILIWDGKYNDGEFIQESDLNNQVYLSFT